MKAVFHQYKTLPFAQTSFVFSWLQRSVAGGEALRLNLHFGKILIRNFRMFGAIKLLVKGLQKPDYDAQSSTEKYEERCYKPAKWVATTVKSISHKDATSQGFQRLFKYISGENEKSTKVDMTAPVTTWVEPGAGPNCESSFTVAFYISSEHQADPPKPSNPEVFIEDRPQFTAYVSQFGGFANDEIWVQKAVELGDAIGDHSKFNDAQYYTAGYDPPFKPFGRTNEVWFVKNEANPNGTSVDDKTA